MVNSMKASLFTIQNSSSVENHKDVVAQKSVALFDGDSRSIAADFAVNDNGLQQVSDLLQAPPQDEVSQELSPLLDDLAETKLGLQQCSDLLHQQTPPREEVAQNIVETRQEASTSVEDTRTKFLKLDNVSACMQSLKVEFDGLVDKVDESLRDRISKFQDEVQYSLKVIVEKVQVDARTHKQDDEVKNHESCATVLEQNEGSNMITNQMQEDIKNIVMSSTPVAEPCVVDNQNIEVEGASSKFLLQEGASNKQGPPQDDTVIIEPESSVDQDHDMRHHDREEPPQEETNEDDPSQEDIDTPDTSHSSKIMQLDGVCHKQGPLQDVDKFKDPSLERDQEYDLQFPSLRPCKQGPSQERMNDGDLLQAKDKAKHDDVVEKKPMHKGDGKQSPELIAEICKREVAVVGTHAGRNRFSLGEYFTFTKTTGCKKAKKKP